MYLILTSEIVKCCTFNTSHKTTQLHCKNSTVNI